MSFDSVFNSFRKFLRLSKAPLGIAVDGADQSMNHEKWDIRTLTFLTCRMCKKQRCISEPETSFVGYSTRCRHFEQGKCPAIDLVFSKVRSREDGLFYFDDEYNCCDELDGLNFDRALQKKDDNSSVAYAALFHKKYLPCAAVSQLYVRKVLAERLVALTKEMCANNVEAICYIDQLLSLPSAIYSKKDLATFKSSIAGLQKVIDAHFAFGGAAAEQAKLDWNQRCGVNDDGGNDDGVNDDADTHKEKKRKTSVD